MLVIQQGLAVIFLFSAWWDRVRPCCRESGSTVPSLGKKCAKFSLFQLPKSNLYLKKKKKVQISLIREMLCFSSLSPKYTNRPKFDCLEFFMRHFKDLPWELHWILFFPLESCIMCHGFCLLKCDTLALSDFAAEYSLLIILRNCCFKKTKPTTNFSSI